MTTRERKKKYKKLITAINKAVKYIETNDAGVRSVELHGPHSGFRIEKHHVHGWTSTEIEK